MRIKIFFLERLVDYSAKCSLYDSRAPTTLQSKQLYYYTYEIKTLIFNSNFIQNADRLKIFGGIGQTYDIHEPIASSTRVTQTYD